MAAGCRYNVYLQCKCEYTGAGLQGRISACKSRGWEEGWEEVHSRLAR